MKTLKMTILSLSALVLMTAAAEAQADVRVRGRVSVGPIKVHVDTAPRHWRYDELSQRDRSRARRLARYTGIPKAHFMELRLRGYSWRGIAHRLDLSMRMVRAARTAESWRDFRSPKFHRRCNG